MEFGILMLINIIVLCIFVVSICFLGCSYKNLLSRYDERGIWQFSIIIGIIVFIIAIYFFIWWGNSFAHDETKNIIMGLILRIIPIILGGIALHIAFLNFNRKSSNNIHYQFNNVLSIKITDEEVIQELSNNYPSYISSVMLKNLKDKKVAIIGMYLEISQRSIICIADYSNKPEIIDAYSTVNLELPPVTLYQYIQGFERNRDMNLILSRSELSFDEKIDPLLRITNQQQISDLITNKAKLILETADGIHYPTLWQSSLNNLENIYKHKFISYRKQYQNKVLPNLTYAICTINLDKAKSMYILVFLQKIDAYNAKISEIRLLDHDFKIDESIYIPKDIYDGTFDVGQTSSIDQNRLLDILETVVLDRVSLFYEDAKLDKESLDFNISYLGQSSLAKRGIFYEKSPYRKIQDI